MTTISRSSENDNLLRSLLTRLAQNQRLLIFFVIINVIAVNMLVLFYQQASVDKGHHLHLQLIVPDCENISTNSAHHVSGFGCPPCNQSPINVIAPLPLNLFAGPAESGSEGRPSESQSESNSMEKEENEENDAMPTELSRPFEKFRVDTNGMCSDKVDVIICVHTHPSRYAWRNLIRQTWANQTYWSNTTVKTVFFTGLVSNDSLLQAALEQESKIWGDIVQAEFDDTYRNLSLKALAVLHWVNERCSNATYFLKLDDDVIVNVFSLQHILISEGIGKNEIACHTFHNITVKRTGKWAVTYEELPKNESYPVFCAGMGYITRVDTALALRQVVYKQRPFFFFWVDDIYVTGFLAQAINATFTAFNTRVLWGQKNIHSYFVGNKWSAYIIGHARNLTLVQTVWPGLVKNAHKEAPSVAAARSSAVLSFKVPIPKLTFAPKLKPAATSTPQPTTTTTASSMPNNMIIKPQQMAAEPINSDSFMQRLRYLEQQQAISARSNNYPPSNAVVVDTRALRYNRQQRYHYQPRYIDQRSSNNDNEQRMSLNN